MASSALELTGTGRSDEALTPTQAVATQNQNDPVQDAQVEARIVSCTEPSITYSLMKGTSQIQIGRHPECQIHVDDKRVSAFHVRIYRDGTGQYFIEGLSSNACYLNEIKVKKGDTRTLKHGDEISLVVHAHCKDVKPFAVYIFRCGGDASKTAQAIGEDKGSNATGRNVQRFSTGSHVVTEDWVTQQWDIRTVLGSGNFSEVRLGVRVNDSTRRAVKVINKKQFLLFQNRRESHLSLSSEVKVLARLDHPNIVKFCEWFETAASMYLVMEFMEGGDLLHCILDGGCFAECRARELFQQIGEAVLYLHDKKLVHRDLKPDNILLTSRDRMLMVPKLADFGLARTNMKSRDCRTFCGTPQYFAPEVITTKSRDGGVETGYGKQADMWSLGVILYIILCGVPPFEDEDLFNQILQGKYEFDVPEWTMISWDAKDLVQKLMTVSYKERLTIVQTLEHRWLRLAPPGWPAEAPKRATDVSQMAADAPDLKRLRTDVSVSEKLAALHLPDCAEAGA